MTPEMIAALSQKRAFATGFFEFDFPSGTRRLMIGSGEVTAPGFILDSDGLPILDSDGEPLQDQQGTVFRGTDPTFGTIAGGESSREDTSGEAPNTSLTIAIHPDANRADIASDAVQLTPVRLYLAALTLDASKHLVAIPDPELLAEGFIDQPIISMDAKKDEVEYQITSGFDYFFEDSEGQRLSPAFYKTIYPSEDGLDNVTGVTRKIYWGQYGPGQTGGIGAGRAAIGGPTGGFVMSGVRPV